MMMKRFVAGAGFAVFAGGAALAQDAPPPPPPGERGPPPMMRPETRAQAEQMAEAMFARLDLNHDGVVTRAEVDAASKAARDKMKERMAEHRARAFERLDKDGNGALSREEFAAGDPPPPGPDGAPPPPPPGDGSFIPHHAMPPRGPGMGHMGMMMADRWFDRADMDHDGKVTLAEAKAAALARFDRLDTDHDGTISPEERGAALSARRGSDGPPPGGTPPVPQD